MYLNKTWFLFLVPTLNEGRHGKGAAKAAMSFGAKYGQGRGLMGQTYGLVTKNLKAGFVEKTANGEIRYPLAGPCSVGLDQIRENIVELYGVARENPSKVFIVIYKADSENLNGYTPKEMWEAFTSDIEVPENMYFHASFQVFREMAAGGLVGYTCSKM